MEELYQRNGILHILSISSLHITILGMSLYHLLRRVRVPVWLSALAGCILLLLYGGLTGFGVSACRAIGMFLIRMTGETLGRTYDMLTALGTVAAVMVLYNPQYLYHSGFLLSFSSVLGIGVLYPALFGKPQNGGSTELHFPQRFEKWAERNRGKERLLQAAGVFVSKIRQSAAASLSVVLATLPVQLWCYYEVPVYAVFLNLLVLPFVKPLMLLGFTVMALPGFLPAGFGAGLILDWYEFLCGCFGRLPFHTWNPGCPKLWQIGVYYLILAVAVAVKGLSGASGRLSVFRRSTPQENNIRDITGKMYLKMTHTCLKWAFIIFAVLLLGLKSPIENHVIFLDVGQGDCILVRTASGENYLFDCGSSSRSKVAEYVLVPYLKYYGIHRLNAVFVSHPDGDHMNGMLELFEMGEESGVEVGELVLPAVAEKLREEQLGQLIAAASSAARSEPAEVRYLAAGDGWQVGSASFLCLNPEYGSTIANTNAFSECVYVEFYEGRKNREKLRGVTTLLLTGDVEGEGERFLLKELAARDIRRTDILKVAHHGSRGTTSLELLEQIKPAVSVISSGRNNSYGHPHEELLNRLDEAGSVILRTSERGAITLRFKDGEILAETFSGAL